MAGYSSSTKMKRKDLEDVYDDFSDFSLSSPARKIRRLDADLPPIIEEEESAGVPLDLDLPLQEQTTFTDEMTSNAHLNEERALVLYKPVNTSMGAATNSSDVSITVDQNLIPSLRNGVFWCGRSDLLTSAADQSEAKDKNTGTDDCLAVVPWVSYHLPSAPKMDVCVVTETSEPMEAEDMDMECGSMEIEDDVSTGILEEQTGRTNGLAEGGGLRQWQQQHCMTPQLPPPTTSMPIMWSW